MSEYLIQSETLTGIADAIRAKKGTTDLIPVQNLASEIASIEGSGGGGTGGTNKLALLVGTQDATNNPYEITAEDLAGATEILERTFQGRTGLKGIEIPETVISIGSYAFYECGNLTSVTFGENSQLTTIGNRAFYGCNKLTNITIPDSVTTIGDYAFRDCDSFTSIIIPDSVTTIGKGAFYNCDYLTSVTIGNSVTTIGDEAFRNCNSLTDVYYTGTEEQWNAISIGSNNTALTNATIHYNYVPE